MADDDDSGAASVWRARAIAAVVALALLLAVAWAVWRENERRYDDLRLTGCFGEVGRHAVSQSCTGNVRRLCRDVPPLIDWRRYCS